MAAARPFAETGQRQILAAKSRRFAVDTAGLVGDAEHVSHPMRERMD